MIRRITLPVAYIIFLINSEEFLDVATRLGNLVAVVTTPLIFRDRINNFPVNYGGVLPIFPASVCSRAGVKVEAQARYFLRRLLRLCAMSSGTTGEREIFPGHPSGSRMCSSSRRQV
ncbi:hypothetical protein J6590_048008 [Homalodisca vitripennis]|nr:hypothetical protein J6590_048008 [Homalodisca vitripennis]